MSTGGQSGDHDAPIGISPDDLWRQVGRTVDGEPVKEDQIRMIVGAVIEGLALEGDDVVIDLACGNGALSQRFFSHCRSLYGVDRSAQLIEVAKTYFELPPSYEFELADVGEFVDKAADPERFTKCICYGSFPLFPKALAAHVLSALGRRFTAVQRIYIGNLPERSSAQEFFARRNVEVTPSLLDDPTSPIGIWWERDDIAALGIKHGWTVRFHEMPPRFYAAHYRFDAIFTRS